MTMPATDFNVPRGSFPTPIKPIGVGPLEPPLVQLNFNYQWCAVITGCLQQMLLNTTWDVDTQAELTAIQEQVFDLMATMCVNPPPSDQRFSVGVEEGPLMLRQNPDNPCELQTSVDGVTWCTWADISKCTPQVTQPGTGSQQPAAGGGCTSYHANLEATGAWLLPAPVNTGDVINVTNAKGAWNDGTINPWQCPDGFNYFAGLCVGSTFTQSGDPVPTSPHMSLIAHIIGGVYFPVLGGSVTIPSGVSFGQLEFICNDSIRSDNLGSIEFDVEVCNNQAASWTHTLDFVLSNQGFVLKSDGGSFRGVWQPGVGWNYTDETRPNTDLARGEFIWRSGISPFTITDCKLVFNYTQGSPSITSNYGIHVSVNNGSDHDVIAKIQSALSNGTDQQLDSGPILFSGVVSITIEAACSYELAGSGFSGAVLLTQLIISGTGVDPF